MLYIIRHAKTDWNELHRLQGRTDIPLNQTGIQMARDAGAEYREVHFDVCYCSPLSRAVRTAELLLEGRGVPIIRDERLVEMGFGEYEGLANCFQIPDCNIKVLYQRPADYVPDRGAESLEELFARTGEFLEQVVKPELAAGRDILIMGHGAMNSSIICQVKGLPLERFWENGIPNCKLMTLVK